jgi:uncharacterized Zn ribbon protein
MATVATISVNFANYGTSSFTPQGVTDRSINPLTLAQYCLGSGTGDFSYIGGFVKKTGDTMSGMLTLPLTMPTIDNHAARKGYVDSRINSLSSTVSDTGAGGFVRISGSTMSGMLTLPVTDPTNVNHSTRKGYVDNRIASLSGQVNNVLDGNPGYLRLSGGTMAGLINLAGHKITQLPTTGLNDTDAVPKKYVDDAIGGGTSGLVSKSYVDSADGLRVLKAGDTMTGFLNLHSNPTLNTHAANKAYVDSVVGSGTSGLVSKAYVDTADSARVLKSGDTMTGFLSLHANPTQNTHAANKAYVDSSILSLTTSIANATNIANNAASQASAANANANNRVLRSGDTMTGNLVVQGSITATLDVTAYSDKRLKNNIEDIKDSLNKLLKLKGVSFDRISDNKKSIGVIAQDVKDVLPEVVSEDKEGYLSVSYGNIVALLIESVKELSNKVDNLEKQLNN